MDATNERRIMELMMNMSAAPDSCQYFLVSPKVTYNDSEKWKDIKLM
jgi:hypothetical protein